MKRLHYTILLVLFLINPNNAQENTIYINGFIQGTPEEIGDTAILVYNEKVDKSKYKKIEQPIHEGMVYFNFELDTTIYSPYVKILIPKIRELFYVYISDTIYFSLDPLSDEGNSTFDETLTFFDSSKESNYLANRHLMREQLSLYMRENIYFTTHDTIQHKLNEFQENLTLELENINDLDFIKNEKYKIEKVISYWTGKYEDWKNTKNEKITINY